MKNNIKNEWYIDNYDHYLYVGYHLDCKAGYIKAHHPTLNRRKSWSFTTANHCQCGAIVPEGIKFQLKLLNEK